VGGEAVVEDDHGLRDVLTRGLRDEGFTVVIAADGGAALRTADEWVDAVVLDIGLPDSHGRDVFHALRAAGISAPVVFLTTRDSLTGRMSGFSSGGDDYLSKHLVPERRLTTVPRPRCRRPAQTVPT
jgi:two-component system response regulator MprA